VRNNDIRLSIPEPDSYYLRVRVEGAPKRSNKSFDITAKSQIVISLNYLRGSTGLFIWSGVVLLIIGVVLNEIRNRTVLDLFGKAGR
jgi:hypothetical protein